MNYEDRREKYRRQVLHELEYKKNLSAEEVQDLIDDIIISEGKKELISYAEKEQLKHELYNSIRRLDILQELLDDEAVTEIMVNGTEKIFVEKNGHLYQSKVCFEKKEKLEDVIQQIVSNCNRVVNESSPIVDARLADGSRVNVVMNPVALNGPILTIRRFPKNPITMEQLIEYGSITKECVAFLERLVRAKYNIFISGGTGSGKTTFLNALSQFIPTEERIITIEDSAELQLLNMKNLVRLETRNANIEGCTPIRIRDLIKSSLRMRPDRVIVGEIRGEEAFDLLQAYNTGHDGSISTGHANSAKDMLFRIESMVLMGMELPLEAIRRQIASGIDIIVHLGRVRDKSRKVLEILEVLGVENGEIVLHPLYQFEEDKAYEEKSQKVKGTLVRKEKLIFDEKLKAAGYEVSEEEY